MIRDLEILIPNCMPINEPDLLRITIKTWIIARFSCIYRVNKITLYRSRKYKDCRREGDIVSLLLRYFKAPPYLKKKLFKKREELKYVGLAPPLQIPTHTVSSKPVLGEVREALIVRKRGHKLVVDSGFPGLIEIEDYEDNYQQGDIILVKVSNRDPLRLDIVSDNRIYRGYEIESTKDIIEYVEHSRDRYWIGTSKMGRPIWKAVGSVIDLLMERQGKVSIVFGEPYRGLFEIGSELGFDPQLLFDDVYNFVPEQGTKSVRIEEALPASLSILRFIEKTIP